MYDSLKKYLNLSEQETFSDLLQVSGWDIIALKPELKPKLAKWEWQISTYIASIRLDEIMNVLPAYLLTEVTDWVDTKYNAYNLVARSMLWSFICKKLVEISNTYMDERIRFQQLKDLGISDIRNNSITQTTSNGLEEHFQINKGGR